MRKYWVEELPGMAPLPRCSVGYCRPDRVSCSFIEEGYFVEYLEYPFDRNRTVAMFFGPKEFLIQCHPVFSTMQALGRSCVASFSYGDIVRTLREFPESMVQYRHVRGLYEKKVAERLDMARMGSDVERFRFVMERQSWVLEKAPGELAAGYLGVTVRRLKEMREGLKEQVCGRVESAYGLYL